MKYMKAKDSLERHSIATLALRFRGLLSRNTVEVWLKTGVLKFEVGPRESKLPQKKRGTDFWLFKTSYLDSVNQNLEVRHQLRVQRQLGNSAGARAIRESARHQAMEILKRNQAVPRGFSMLRERDPALNDYDATGKTCLTDLRPKQIIQSGWLSKP